MDKPMLAAAYRDGADLCFPLLATPKIDGIRALVAGGRLVSRSFRPIPNVTIRNELERMLPEGADGEISCGSLYETTSIVMSEYKKSHVTFSWFDWAFDLDAPYGKRAAAMKDHVLERDLRAEHVTVVALVPIRIDSARGLKRYESAMLARGHEGVVVRSPQGRYKCGRSTLKEGLMIKIKRDDDFEATIVGTEELMHNANEARADNFGNTKRSSSRLHLVPGNTLGAIVARDIESGTFHLGTGFSSNERDALWANRDVIVGQLVKYKLSGRGSRGLPRSPVFLENKELQTEQEKKVKRRDTGFETKRARRVKRRDANRRKWKKYLNKYFRISGLSALLAVVIGYMSPTSVWPQPQLSLAVLGVLQAQASSIAFCDTNQDELIDKVMVTLLILIKESYRYEWSTLQNPRTYTIIAFVMEGCCALLWLGFALSMRKRVGKTFEGLKKKRDSAIGVVVLCTSIVAIVFATMSSKDSYSYDVHSNESTLFAGPIILSASSLAAGILLQIIVIAIGRQASIINENHTRFTSTL